MELQVFSRQFEYFLKSADFTSFRIAAHYLGITQPALSQAIHQLEEQLGVALFERSRSGVILTDAGQALVREFKTFRKDAVEKIKLSVRQPSAPVLRMGSTAQFFRLHLYPYLERTDGLSKYKLYLANTFQCHAAVESGEVDLAFFASTEISKDLVYQKIKDDPFCVVGLTKKYAHIARAKSMDELRNEEWIDGRYEGKELFSASISVVAEGMHDFKLCLLLGMGIATVQWDYFLPSEQKLLTKAPFVPMANSPGYPLLPPGKAPVIYLAHKKHVPRQTKKTIDDMLEYFRTSTGP